MTIFSKPQQIVQKTFLHQWSSVSVVKIGTTHAERAISNLLCSAHANVLFKDNSKSNKMATIYVFDLITGDLKEVFQGAPASYPPCCSSLASSSIARPPSSLALGQFSCTLAAKFWQHSPQALTEHVVHIIA
jgi:hypothetical protein